VAFPLRKATLRGNLATHDHSENALVGVASASPQSIGFAVIGAGAFGSNHLRVIRELSDSGDLVRLAAIVESDTARGRNLHSSFPGVRIFHDIDACLAACAAGDIQVQAASVCVPTSAHAAVASALLQAGIDVLVEKPIAASLAEADALIALASLQQRILQIGHLERFNPAVLAVHPYIHMPMFFEAHRLSVFTPRSLDVDVILDLMVHDLDIVLSLVQSPVHSLQAVGLPVLSRKVDIANVRIEFASGCVANFTASRVSTERVRKLRFFQPHQYVSIDYARQDLLFIDVKPQDSAPGGSRKSPAWKAAPCSLSRSTSTPPLQSTPLEPTSTASSRSRVSF
jgi:predicted dehydrogenase